MTTTNLLSPTDEQVGGQMEKSPSFVERQFVHEVYDEIAHCFSSPDEKQHKNRRWPNVVAFLDSLSEGSFVCDVGCGDGKYMATEAALSGRLSIVSVDLCANLLRTAALYASKTPCCDVVASNNLTLAFRDSCFDAVVSVGVLHHFSTVERRIQALRELGRLLNPNGGRLLVYVWALEQPRRNFSAQDILVPSDVDLSPATSRPKLKKATSAVGGSNCNSPDTPSWPSRNGHSVVFEEFPNWWDSKNDIGASWDNIASNLDDDKETDSCISKTDEAKDDKMSVTSSESKLIDPSASAPASSSFFSRILPTFLRSRSKSSCKDLAPPSEKTDCRKMSTSTTADDNTSNCNNTSESTAPNSPSVPAANNNNNNENNHASLTNQRSLYRYYHVFCRGELEKLVDALNRECYDAKLHQLELTAKLSTSSQQDQQELQNTSNPIDITEKRPPLRRPPSSSLPTFESLGLTSDTNNNSNSDESAFKEQSQSPSNQQQPEQQQQQQTNSRNKVTKMHLKIVRAFYDHANWAVELERVY